MFAVAMIIVILVVLSLLMKKVVYFLKMFPVKVGKVVMIIIMILDVPLLLLNNVIHLEDIC